MKTRTYYNAKRSIRRSRRIARYTDQLLAAGGVAPSSILNAASA